MGLFSGLIKGALLQKVLGRLMGNRRR